MPVDFEPRSAALNAAARVAMGIDETVRALTYALVYVGDQVRALSDVTDEPDRVTLGDLRESLENIAAMHEPVDAEVVDQAKVDYADALRRIADHEEFMGSGPPDDEMRAIARKALEGVEDG